MTASDTGALLPITQDITALVERLRAQAVCTSEADRMLAEAKSLRQTDNPERRSDLYSWVKPGETVEGQAADALTRLAAQSEPRAQGVGDDALPEALEWYGEQARLCRLIHSEGNAGRQALDADGGKRARAALAASPAPPATTAGEG